MDISDVRLNLTHKEGAVKAFGSLSFDNEFAVRGLRVMQDKNGRNFVAMPSRQKGDGTYEDVCFPLNKELYKDVQEAVLSKYDKVVELDNQKGKEEVEDAKQAEDKAMDQAESHKSKKSKGR